MTPSHPSNGHHPDGPPRDPGLPPIADTSARIADSLGMTLVRARKPGEPVAIGTLDVVWAGNPEADPVMIEDDVTSMARRLAASLDRDPPQTDTEKRFRIMQAFQDDADPPPAPDTLLRFSPGAFATVVVLCLAVGGMLGIAFGTGFKAPEVIWAGWDVLVGLSGLAAGMLIAAGLGRRPPFDGGRP